MIKEYSVWYEIEGSFFILLGVVFHASLSNFSCLYQFYVNFLKAW